MLESVHIAVMKRTHTSVSTSLYVLVLTLLSTVVLYVVLLTGMRVMPLRTAHV